ncbi:hypothetical protein COV11_04580 [Candidatus Woesearchaeota archaeon CG10_big_fil_rev_8_21_14_0_10_30_7]|nr:MAG: hypothetical protein COV11_04580 [Candidatus Woesearchaeota archaeon CG10_big_fil_rev_8_21_14_0_10_30_7]
MSEKNLKQLLLDDEGKLCYNGEEVEAKLMSIPRLIAVHERDFESALIGYKPRGSNAYLLGEQRRDLMGSGLSSFWGIRCAIIYLKTN